MKRVFTALLLIPVFVYVVLWAPHLLFLAVLAAVALLCYREYARVAGAYGFGEMGPVGYAAGLAVLLIPQEPALLVTLIALLALSLSLSAGELAKGLPRAALLFLGVVYIFGVWRTAIPLRARSPHWLLFVLSLTWIGDAAAYYLGRRFGRHKMAPRVSPAKSWEGAAASLVASVAFAALYVPRFIPGVPLWVAMLLGAAANVAGQIGDLAESALKRGAGVKDSGHMLPGHGGWLDRVDSALFAMPVLWLILAWL
jgi:phosphatidate cytidylyltransferase